MRITRMVTGPDGHNMFNEIDVYGESGGGSTETIQLPHTSKAYITTLVQDYNTRRDPTPHHHKRQYIIILQGAMEVTLQNGDKRVVAPGVYRTRFLGHTFTLRGMA